MYNHYFHFLAETKIVIMTMCVIINKTTFAGRNFCGKKLSQIFQFAKFLHFAINKLENFTTSEFAECSFSEYCQNNP